MQTSRLQMDLPQAYVTAHASANDSVHGVPVSTPCLWMLLSCKCIMQAAADALLAQVGEIPKAAVISQCDIHSRL